MVEKNVFYFVVGFFYYSSSVHEGLAQSSRNNRNVVYILCRDDLRSTNNRRTSREIRRRDIPAPRDPGRGSRAGLDSKRPLFTDSPLYKLVFSSLLYSCYKNKCSNNLDAKKRARRFNSVSFLNRFWSLIYNVFVRLFLYTAHFLAFSSNLRRACTLRLAIFFFFSFQFVSIHCFAFTAADVSGCTQSSISFSDSHWLLNRYFPV